MLLLLGFAKTLLSQQVGVDERNHFFRHALVLLARWLAQHLQIRGFLASLWCRLNRFRASKPACGVFKQVDFAFAPADWAVAGQVLQPQLVEL